MAMAVAASLSLNILVERRTLGFIVCNHHHHRRPLPLFNTLPPCPFAASIPFGSHSPRRLSPRPCRNITHLITLDHSDLLSHPPAPGLHSSLLAMRYYRRSDYGRHRRLGLPLRLLLFRLVAPWRCA
ncbi:uncharacterized protein LY79DRAFT_536093 [Colletotrichum navitas]|uniref:Uncharacterized protein n=1 Tax=Colletotrichum navitas TaxID=681940 RepID=A0AAD8QCD0_9PEZI|nr:uncharacterized protein LY79DRAFT_536093 [Colletotrichum navitas]KAK1599785.1 hypothetical protein LY79DRAFT_536093 [Colletotrichum navitas]